MDVGFVVVRVVGFGMDTRRGFRPHRREVVVRTTSVSAAVSRLLPKTGGPTAAKRRLLTTVIYAKL